jgi:anaerobic ribonucleoside-triphosphate reductase activating protein
VGVILRVAQTCVGTRTLGPGLRSVVWVQGCPFTCRGCVSPDWIPPRGGRLVAVEELVRELLADEAVEGLTFSGGEPMVQAAGLARLARLAKSERDLTVVCFSGFTLGRLRSRPPGPGVGELLEQVDVLVDGTYVASANSGRGLRGSTNQVVHHLTDRLAAFDFEEGVRRVELRVDGGGVLMVGVPPDGLLARLDQVEQRWR